MKDPIPKNQPDKFEPFIYPIKDKCKLERTIVKNDKEFLDVIFSRRSSSKFSRISLDQLSHLLHLSTKIQSLQVDETGYIITNRTTPSAGARHPVDLLVSIDNPHGNRFLSYYNPIDHSLNELSLQKKELQDFFNEISKNLSINNACIIWFSIQVAKTGSKYENPESLYWKDTGALLYCIQLIATYLGLKSCPLGTLANSSFKNLFKTEFLHSGGGVLVGV